MSSLRATRETLLFAYCEEWLDDMEFVVLNELNSSENLDFPYDAYAGSTLTLWMKPSLLANFILRNDTFCD